MADPEDTLHLLKRLKSVKGPKVITAAFDKEDAKDFYKNGADYVVMPHLAGGRHVAKMLVDKKHLKLIERYREKDMLDLARFHS